MLRPRVIPCLLLRGGRLVKTVGFGDDRYIGDPLNAVRIFNEKNVDELFVIDIDATAKGRGPDYALIESLAVECRMPLGYGGGIVSVEQASRIIHLGVEKIALSAAAIADPTLVTRLAEHVGRQSVVVVLDTRRDASGRHQVWTHNGTRATNRMPEELAEAMVAAGCGEIVLNSIDRDGEMKGYDLDLIARVQSMITVPLTALGGAGKVADIEALFARCGVVGAAAGSLFVFKGSLRAVLISYPDAARRRALSEVAQRTFAASPSPLERADVR